MKIYVVTDKYSTDNDRVRVFVNKGTAMRTARVLAHDSTNDEFESYEENQEGEVLRITYSDDDDCVIVVECELNED